MDEPDGCRVLIDDNDLKIYVIKASWIVVVQVMSWKRETVDKWIAFIRASNDKLRSPVRILYDLREAGPPSQYFLDVLGPVIRELNLPDDIRSAYVFNTGPYARFASSFMRRTPTGAGQIKDFTDWDEAIDWLTATDV
ncbi:MAG: hypothetical protein H6673_15200 [Anaerolineales bacterium]|nr:hypothetical protein [Anaerolineales bacterium]